MTAAAIPVLPGRESASRLVPCDRCGASQHQPCPGGTAHRERELLASERGHLNRHTGEWLTRGWHEASAREVAVLVRGVHEGRVRP